MSRALAHSLDARQIAATIRNPKSATHWSLRTVTRKAYRFAKQMEHAFSNHLDFQEPQSVAMTISPDACDL